MLSADTGAAAADDDEGSDGAQTIQQVYVERLKKLLVAPVTHLSSGKGAKKKYKHHYASTITSDQAAVSSAVCALVGCVQGVLTVPTHTTRHTPSTDGELHGEALQGGAAWPKADATIDV